MRLHRWHRRAGLLAAGFLVYLLASGIPLQFSSGLDLGKRFVTSDFILDWYGLEAPETALTSGGLVAVGEELFANGRHLLSLNGFVGALGTDGLVAAAGERELLLFDRSDLSLLDRFRFDQPLHRIGRHDGRLALETSSGTLLSDPELVNWQPSTQPVAEPVWATLEPADAGTTEQYRRAFRARMLSLERLLQDLHSGRLFGTTGVIVIDIASALLLFLAVSGLVMWWRGTNGRRS